MKFFSFALALGAASLLDTVFADASVAVDRLVSKRHLTKRDAGFRERWKQPQQRKGCQWETEEQRQLRTFVLPRQRRSPRKFRL